MGNGKTPAPMLIGVLIFTALVLGVLTAVAQHASEEIIKAFGVAVGWTTDFLGVAAVIAGFLGISTGAARGLAEEADIAYASGGMLSILAGATLLETGGGPVPIALAIAAVGIGAVFFRKHWPT